MNSAETNKLPRTHESADLRSINPTRCFQSLAENERSYISIPAPAWLTQKDDLRKSFERYPELWLGGKVVWGHVVQANKLLFSPGKGNSPAEVIYDPSGKLGWADLVAPASKMYDLKNTKPDDATLRAVADHLTDERDRASGMRVPHAVSPHGLMMSTLLISRAHLPDNKLTLGYFPLLIHDRLPGVTMVLPSRWWPGDLTDAWLGKSSGRQDEPAKLDVSTSTSALRHCTNCRQPMRKLGLAAHYNRQVEIDVCEPCSLIWFDDTESARLAGPGLADLVRVIHHAMQNPRPLQPLPLKLPCPICSNSLRRVSNISRFGRTSQLQCPEKDGAYQSFTQFLAEKGYFRAYTWGDIKQLTAAGKDVQCFGCGATLEPKPQSECSYCQSPVGMIDPARLARAIDIEEVAPKLTLAPTMKQVSCPCCGGAINLVEEMVCPHCQAIVRPIETERAAQASQTVEAAVRQNYEQQTEDVSRRKMQALYADVSASSSAHDDGRTRRWLKFGWMVGVLGLLLYFWHGMHHNQPNMRLYLPDNQLNTTSEVEFQKLESAHVAEMKAKIPHDPAGVVPPMLSVKMVNGGLEVTSLTKKHILVSAVLVDEQFGVRCKSLISDDPHRGPTATYSKMGETHTMLPYECNGGVRTSGVYEYEVWSLDDDQFIFASDSAFRHQLYNPTGLR